MREKFSTIFIAAVFALIIFTPLCYGANTFALSASSPKVYENASSIIITAADVKSACADVSDAEKPFLCSPAFSLGRLSPEITLIPNGGKLDISAKPVTTDGITFVPDKMILDGKAVKYSDGEAELPKSDYVVFDYAATVHFDSASVDEYSNAAFYRARELAAKQHEYEVAAAAYQADLAAYDEFLSDMGEYESLYAAYMKDKKQYDRDYILWHDRKVEYDEYLAELASYEQECAEYENYDRTLSVYYEKLARYKQYLSDLEVYRSELEHYEDELIGSGADKALYQLSILEYMRRAMTDLNRSLSAAILGNSVTEVLGQTEALVLAGADRAAVNRAVDATIALRRLIPDYLALTSDEQRYIYYIGCYEELRDCFNDLLRTIDYFYRYQAVRGELIKRNKTQQYEILLAQLYYICNALTDERVSNYIMEYKYTSDGAAYFDENYKIQGKSPAEILGEENMLEDRNAAAPLENGYPIIPAMPTEPEKAENPGEFPPAYRKPIAPEPTAEPGTQPKEPIPPAPPQHRDMPAAPTSPEFSADELKLMQAYNGGELTRVEPADFDMPIVVKVVAYFRNKEVTLNFHDANGNATSQIKTEKGTHVDIIPPEKFEEGYDCSFVGWTDGEGNDVNLDFLLTDKSELALFPKFEKTLKECTISFYVDGSVSKKQFPYGSVPEVDAPVKTGERLYKFKGWKSRSGILYKNGLPAVNGDASYAAVFDESFLVSFNVDGEVTNVPYWKGEEVRYDGEPFKPFDGVFAYKFVGWDKKLVPAERDIEYNAVFERKYLVGANNGYCTVSRDDAAYETYSAYANGTTLDVGELIKLAASDGSEIRFNLSGNVIRLSPAMVYAAYAANVKTFDFEFYGTGANSYSYKMTLTDGAETLALDGFAAKLTVKGDFDKDSYVFAEIDGTKKFVRFKQSVGTVEFSVKSGISYSLRAAYEVKVINSEFACLSVSSSPAAYGERVYIQADSLKKGMRVRSFYVVASDGADIAVDQNGCFVMPKCAVTVGVICDYIEYIVVFKAEGRTLLTQKLRYGEDVVPPGVPVKPSDGKYSYVFKGWDKEIGSVTGNVEYNAVFERVRLDDEGLKEASLNKFIRAMYVVLSIIFVGIVALIVALIIKKRKKHN